MSKNKSGAGGIYKTRKQMRDKTKPLKHIEDVQQNFTLGMQQFQVKLLHIRKALVKLVESKCKECPDPHEALSNLDDATELKSLDPDRWFYVAYDADEIVHDAFDLDDDIGWALKLLESSDDYSSSRLMEQGFEIGRLLERMRVRDFEPFAAIGRERVDHGRKTLKKYRRVKTCRNEVRDAMDSIKEKHPDRRDDNSFIVNKTAKRLCVHRSTVYRRLREAN